MGVRKPTNGCPRKHIGRFPSLKSKTSEWFESLLERDMLHLLEIDPGVVFFRTQPLIIKWTTSDQPHFHIPDILVVRRNTKQIIEVKPEEKTLEEEFILRTKYVSAICRQRGFEYCVVTEKFIQQEPRLSNVKLLFKYSRTDLSQSHQAQLYGFFKERETATVRELETIFGFTRIARNIVYALMYWGHLTVDLNHSISSDSVVMLSAGNIYKEGIA